MFRTDIFDKNNEFLCTISAKDIYTLKACVKKFYKEPTKITVTYEIKDIIWANDYIINQTTDK